MSLYWGRCGARTARRDSKELDADITEAHANSCNGAEVVHLYVVEREVNRLGRERQKQWMIEEPENR